RRPRIARPLHPHRTMSGHAVCRTISSRSCERKDGNAMMMRRRRPLMRAAMVGGVAYHAGKKSQEGRDADYERDARMDELEAQQAQQAQAPPAGGMTDNTIEQLGKLGQLHEQGVLTDGEVEVQKQKLLEGV